MSPESEELAARIRDVIGYKVGITEKKMFGGVCFLHRGNMVVGSMKSGEMLMRVGPERHKDAIARSGYSAMVQGGKEMVGFVFAGYDEIADEDDLKSAIEFCLDFVKTLPPKS